ncbi:MAG: hypothetical protein FD180_4104 [Planctomycetota bacterium]|nr:MAG: hypothetical protein FD180_4104 [Planctomycetota bacterium]
MSRSAVSAALVLAAALACPGEDPTPGTQAQPGTKLTQREIAFHCLNRLSFGPRPGEVDDILSRGWMAWALEQLEPEKIDDSALQDRLKRDCPSVFMTASEAIDRFRPKELKDRKSLSPEELLKLQQEFNRLRRDAQEEMRSAVVLRAALSKRQLNEVLVNFWRNHFSIDQSKDQCQLLAASYEEEVIRRHVFGKFEDMLMACAKNPGMLVYLDNVFSQRPLSEREKEMVERGGANRKKSEFIQKLERQRGLNENFARELMELHTVGVQNENVPGGYTQQDVIAVARALTGWTVSFGEDRCEFVFRKEWHDDDPKKIGVLNLSLTGAGGIEEGEEIIRRLARHPLTAKFICWKLCRHLVNDQPPAALVDKAAAEYLKTGGDLKAVYQAIVFGEDFYRRENFRVKFKTPFEFTISALRATGSSIENTNETLRMLDQMGQPTCRSKDPTGFFDQAEAWLDPGVLVYRWQFALRLASGRMGGITMPADYFKPILAKDPAGMKEALEATILPGGVDPATEARCAAIVKQGLKPRQAAEALLGALLGSPTFQEQ